MDWEFYILNYIQNNFRSDLLDAVMPFISLLGAAGVLWILIAVISLITKKYRRFGKSLVFYLIFAFIICNLIFKPVVNRIRPYELNTMINLLVSPEIDASFPSGHTFFAFGTATVFFIYNKKAGICMYILASAIAASRLYLYVHFPTDVLFGMILGIITAVVSYKIEKFIFSDNNKNKSGQV